MWVIALVCLGLSCLSVYVELAGAVKGSGPSGLLILPTVLAAVLLALGYLVEAIWRGSRVDLRPYLILWALVLLLDAISLLIPSVAAWLRRGRR